MVHDARIPTRDPGVTLGANLFLPVTSTPVPALVTILHNSKDGIAGIGGAPYLEYFAARGYASVLVDRLGTGSSDGVERPAFDPGDGDDGVAAVQWAAAQPWCNGNVGMWGLSYGAINTLRTASRRPPALKAIVPIMGMLDPERDFVHPCGERGAMSYFGLAGVWNLFIQLQPSIADRASPEATRRWEQRVRDFEPWLMDAWRHGPGDPRWRSRVIDASNIEVPSFCIAGWHDVFLAGTVRAYEQIRAPKRLLIGPWMHELPNESPREPVDAIRLACDWWQRWLVDEPAHTGDPAGQEPAVIHLGGASPSWVTFTTWPPAGPSLTLAATADGALRRVENTVETGTPDTRTPDTGTPDTGTPDMRAPARFIRWASDRTVGALSGLGSIPLAGFGFPLDQHEDDSRSLTFTTEPLTEPLVLAGTATVELVVGSHTTARRCVAKLADVDARGTSTLVAVGVAKLPAEPPVGRTVAVELNPAGHEVMPGHRLRLVLSDSDLPRLWPGAPGARLDIGVQSSEASAATRVVVPVCEPTDRAVSLPGPADLPRPFSGSPPTRTWRITRDHATGAVSVTVGDAAAASLTVAADEIHLERAVEVTVRVSGEPSQVYLTGTGRLTITDHTGDRTVVTAQTHVHEDSVAASGQVVVNDAVVVARKWSA
jgi:putative CocE/NonD family hydrolase